MINRFTSAACNVLKNAMSFASDAGHTYIGSEHILLGLLGEKNTAAYKILTSSGITFEASRDMLISSEGKGARTELSPSDMTPRAKSIIESAYQLAGRFSCRYVATEHLLLALIREDDSVGFRIITEQGVDIVELESEVSSYCASGQLTSAPLAPSEKKNAKGHSLKSGLFGKSLTDIAAKGGIDPVIGREDETLRLIRTLSRRTKNNPVLIGEPGVGKTAIVEGLALRIAEGSVPENLIGKKIYSVDITSLVAGAKYRGEFEERFKQMINEASGDPNIILFIDEIHNLVGAGGAEGAIDGANIMKPMLARGELRIIGATTVSEFRKIEKDAALERRFQSILVEEPSVAQTITILEGLRSKYEEHHKVTISDRAIRSAAQLSARYISGRFLPDKAIDLIDEASARVRIGALTYPEEIRALEKRSRELSSRIESALAEEDYILAADCRSEQENLDSEIAHLKNHFRERLDSQRICVEESDIEEVVTEWTKIPVSTLARCERERLLTLDSELARHIAGQERALTAVAGIIRRSRLGLKKENSPSGSFIFAGPTGVGKTECAKVLSRLIFGGGSSLIHLDMSEYGEAHSISRLIGAPPGYVGYDEGGKLTERVRRHPYSVVLFDEIEKAHPDICSLLLQILDEGRLTDSSGRQVDFSNTVIILTTNIGADKFRQSGRIAGFSHTGDPSDADEAVRREVEKELRKSFRAELLSRIDEIVVFSPLSTEAQKAIAEKYLSQLCSRLEGRNISATYTDKCADAVALGAYSKETGARQTERYIYSKIESLISRDMLTERITEGDSIVIDYDEKCDNFVILSKDP